MGAKARNGMGSGGPPVLGVSPDHGAAYLIDSDARRTRNESTGVGASLAAGSLRLSPSTGGLPCDPGGNSTRSGFYGCHYSSHLV
jgi:hypothetical protein